MSIHYTLTLDDLIAFNRNVAAPILKRSKITFLIPLTLLYISLIYINGSDILPIATMVYIAMLVYIKWGMPKIYEYRVAKLLDNDVALGDHTFIINDKGINDIQKEGQVESAWSSIERIDQDAQYIFLFQSQIRAYVIPKNAFATPDEATTFYEKAVELWTAVTTEKNILTT